MTHDTTHPDEAAFLRYLTHLQALRAAGRPWPRPVYEAMLKLMSHCSWEPVPTRQHRGRLQFLYSLRDADDLAYPPDPVKGQPWYFAGAYNRGEPSADAFARISAEDFPGGRLRNPQLVGCMNWYREPRGPDVGLVFRCEYEGEVPPHCRWYDWDQLPDHMIACHRMLAERVIQAIRDGESTPWFVDDPR